MSDFVTDAERDRPFEGKTEGLNHDRDWIPESHLSVGFEGKWYFSGGGGGGGNSTSEDKKKSLLLAKWNLSNVTHFNTQSQERDDDLIKISIQETLDLTYAQEFI